MRTFAEGLYLSFLRLFVFIATFMHAPPFHFKKFLNVNIVEQDDRYEVRKFRSFIAHERMKISELEQCDPAAQFSTV